MRRLVGILRTPDQDVDLEPQPGLAQIGSLSERMRRAGVEVAVHVKGEPVDLSPSMDISAYRIVQEALTNVLRHAAASRAAVRIEHAPASLTIEVTDNGHGRATGADDPGHGTAGMRERAAMYGGSVDAGPAPGGGWRLFAVLPREPMP